ncbi:MAG: VWA-like domain-containing protein [Bacillota bacterium]
MENHNQLESVDNLELQKQLEKVEIMILNNIRSILAMKLGFLNIALHNLELKKYKGTFIVNGKEVFYNPEILVKEYKNAPRIFVHMILHCVFLHMFVKKISNVRCWNLACDIAVENIINHLNIKELQSDRVQDVEAIVKNVRYMTAEHIYRYLLQLSDRDLGLLEYMFYVDDHTPWYPDEKIDITGDKKTGDGNADDSDRGSNSSGGSRNSSGTSENEKDINENAKSPRRIDDGDEEVDEEEKPASENTNHTMEDNSPNMVDYDSAETSRNSLDFEDEKSRKILNEHLRKQKLCQWKNIAETIESDIETFSISKGDKSGNLKDNLKYLNREKVDYKEFLRKFATLKETIEVNDDEFDYVFYHYGLSITGNMPLIEPLEYKESNNINDFVIAIDTSGSVAGELVSKFLNKTYNILSSQETFAKKVNIHIVQCDSEIQSVTIINRLDDIKGYMENLVIKGYGGTDFRPVFEYVNRCVDEGKLNNLKGVLYFTDGMGTFPMAMPKYKTAVVYIKDYCEFQKIPHWAIKLELDLDEIETIEKITYD